MFSKMCGGSLNLAWIDAMRVRHYSKWEWAVVYLT